MLCNDASFMFNYPNAGQSVYLDITYMYNANIFIF